MFGSTQSGTPTGFGGFGSTNTATPTFGAKPATTSTNLFGNQQQQGGGLFGAKPATTGMFGQQQQQQQPSTTTGGLFGQPQQQQQTSSAGGLFGQQQRNQPSTGLFGQNQPISTANTGTGLFGQPQQNQQQTGTTGGLFGQQQQQQQQSSTGGLFGNKPNGGLFGQQPQQQSTTGGGGLFGQQQPPQQNTTGGLFGGSSNTNTSLFGQQPQPQQQQTQNPLQLTAMTRVGDLPGNIKTELEQFDKYINTQHLIATTLNSDYSKHDNLINSIPKDITYLQNKLLSTKQALKFDSNQLLNLKQLNNELTEDINKIMHLILQLSTPGTKLSSSFQLNEFFIKKIKKYYEILNQYEEMVGELDLILSGLEKSCSEGFGNLFSIVEVIKSQYGLFMELCETLAQLHNQVNRLTK